MRRWQAIALAAGVPLLLFAGHAALFGSWIVDDAGVSYAYARSLAGGDGPVAQPGAEPVEGFTNLAWVLLLAAAMAAGLFDPVWTAKALSGLAVAGAFVLLARALVPAGRQPVGRALPVGAGLAATAVLTPFAAWSVSGLENPLQALLVAALVAGSLGVARAAAGPAPRHAAGLGLLLLLLYATRPDALLYLPLPAFFLGTGEPGGARRWRPAAAYWAGFAVPWIVLTAGRLFAFHDVLPNTYYAKKGAAWREVQGLLDGLGLGLGGLVFMVAVPALAAAAVAVAFLAGRRAPAAIRRWPEPAVLAGYAAVGYLAFELLPTDWMPEYRFATPVFLLAPPALLETCAAAVHGLPERRRRAATAAAAVAVLAAAMAYGWRHSRAFAAAPTVPFAQVRALSRALDDAAGALGVERAAVLLPDIGGALWEDRFTVVDMAGLTDRDLGHDPRGGRAAYLRAIDRRRPELVWIHGYWVERTGLLDAPEFTGRYLRLPVESAVPGSTLWVRRDLAGDPGRLARAARAFEEAGV